MVPPTLAQNEQQTTIFLHVLSSAAKSPLPPMNRGIQPRCDLSPNARAATRNVAPTTSWAYDGVVDPAATEATDRVVWQSSQVPDASLQQLIKEANKTRQRT